MLVVGQRTIVFSSLFYPSFLVTFLLFHIPVSLIFTLCSLSYVFLFFLFIFVDLFFQLRLLFELDFEVLK